ncbi:hypothetical protein [[Mycoplasma] gypis]|uniref:Uncharacterized protein n=1 Tax=[Mycoplasma] gypis TaxID=92404 RepID=A0ABZ2RPI0_9BACT|nr:hypothetical protein [[Mycoplasma] gypis]MBN0919161.1 hypothetical protein [[Mycoplasma] gypis]
MQNEFLKCKKIIHKITLILLKENKLIKYKNLFKNKQMQFLVSKILILFGTDFDANKLANVEIELMNSNFQRNMFVNILLNHIDSVEEKYRNCNWKSLGKYLYYIFKTSTYYSDLRHQVPNIFDIIGVDAANEKKREALNDFYLSLEKVDKNYNHFVRQILLWTK